ncbi:DivIVA domain-containing protein [Nocardia sp. NBC_01327]|uniref:DivIVA domain-containing protein n=1 Tax=Nocardia sp. NBC_01327 TaxID=2903593 RepID=UPI002E0E286D|nr:DivIVA domain-containing protein [Nocardia sp. NBC_01327]
MDVTPEDIQSARFKGARLGRRGYDADDVDLFLTHVRATVLRLARENGLLTLTSNSEELLRLQRENRQLSAKCDVLQGQMQTMSSAGEKAELQRQLSNANWEISRLQDEMAKDAQGISAQAVDILNRAQLSADSIIGQAEEHARDLMRVAREQHREMLYQARVSGSNGANRYTDQAAEDQRYEQLRTYSGLLRSQLQAMIMTLSVEVDKLALLPMPGAADGAGEIDHAGKGSGGYHDEYRSVAVELEPGR